MRNEKRRNFLTLLTVICSMLLIMGCSNPFELSKQSAPVEAGYGRVSISFAGGQARTVLPAKVFDNYVYTFTGDGQSLVLSPDNEGLFTLSVGAWRVDVTAYVGEISPANLAATGTANFTLSSGPTTEVEVALDAVVTSGYGTFICTIQYPAIADAEVTLKKLPELTDSVDLTPDSEETDDGIIVITKTATNVPAGFYLLRIRILRDDGWQMGISEAVHIYPLLLTEYAVQFDEGGLLPPTVIHIDAIGGITPVIGQAPVTEITETEQYTGTVEWNPHPAHFAAVTTYTATITLSAKKGYTLQGVPANFFTTAGATNVSNTADSGEITAVFITPYYLAVTNTTEWNNALTTIRSGGNDKSYIIEVDGDVGVGGIAANSTTGLGTVTGITVTLIGNGKLYLSSQGSIIRVGANQTLIIDSGDLILQGLRSGQNGYTQNNNNSAVYVNGTGAQLELKNGTISGNRVTSSVSSSSESAVSEGGGVFVSSGIFTMNGGEISGNTASASASGSSSSAQASSRGGGVYVGNGGTFIINNGKISGNIAISSTSNSGDFTFSRGGGVYMNGGSFTMNGGEISGNTASGRYPEGGGVYVNSGTFTMNGGTISRNTTDISYPTSSNSYGGGVYISSNGTFIMNNGKVSGNTVYGYYSNSSVHGGGVCVWNLPYRYRHDIWYKRGNFEQHRYRFLYFRGGVV